ncbi:anthranilate phosphoribosyltransferase [Candidatus Binatia bacterium]|nr:anthranilate phosphoribosyltransferase [Candidatus Binatia bacterium]
MSSADALRAALIRLCDGVALERDGAAAAFEEIMSGAASPTLIGAFLATLRARGETVDVVVAAAGAMRAHARRVATTRTPVVDNCGTGGDGWSTFSISTAAALVAAGAGAAVAKHGNRGASGKFGGADALEKLGVRIELDAEQAGRCLDEVGMAFLFAPAMHPAMRHAGPVRRELGFRTVFNLLGPLTNPAGVRRQVVGVPSRDALRLVAGALAALGCEHALVVHSRDGLDEISLGAPTDALEVRGGTIVERLIESADFGLDAVSSELLRASSADESAAAVRSVLDGRNGPHADVVLANAAAVLHVAGLASSLADGTTRAREAIATGAARDVLARLVAFTTAVEARST